MHESSAYKIKVNIKNCLENNVLAALDVFIEHLEFVEEIQKYIFIYLFVFGLFNLAMVIYSITGTKKERK